MGDNTFTQTPRLLIRPLTTEDEAFIFELVNTEGWIRFIGDRSVHSLIDARAYIQRILDNPGIRYWVVNLQESGASIGLVTFIRRTYLEHHDIGFAFLPLYGSKGYAFEATAAVLEQLVKTGQYAHILATTIPGNTASIRLLEKLGLGFEKELFIENIHLHLYGAPVDQLTLYKQGANHAGNG